MIITVNFIKNILDGMKAEEWTNYAQKNFTIETLMSTLVGFPILAEAYLEAERNKTNLELANKQLYDENIRLKQQILENDIKDD